MSVYASFGLGFDSPAKNELESLNPANLYNDSLMAQESKNFEVGIKGNLLNFERTYFRKLLFEATVFNIRINNEIVPLEVLGDVFFRNAAETNRTGLELGSSLEILKGLNFVLAYTYSNFKYTSYLAKTIYVDSTGSILEKEDDFSNNIVPSVPKNNLYLALSYDHQIIKHVNGFVKFSYNGISGLWVDDANTDKTDGYNLLNTVLGVDITFGGFDVLISGGVSNLFDEVYVGFTNTNSADLRFYEAGAPRNYYISVNLGYTF
jgi:iron complex outermembrane receptor protein